MSLTGNQSAFLAAFCACGLVGRAASAANVSRRSHYRWLAESEEYQEAFADAQEEATDLLEEEARRRAYEGTRRYKFEKGEPVIDPRTGEQYFELEYSDRLMEILLRGNRPRKFANRHELTGANGGALEVNHSLGGLVVGDQEISDGLCDALETAVENQRERPGDSES